MILPDDVGKRARPQLVGKRPRRIVIKAGRGEQTCAGGPLRVLGEGLMAEPWADSSRNPFTRFRRPRKQNRPQRGARAIAISR